MLLNYFELLIGSIPPSFQGLYDATGPLTQLDDANVGDYWIVNVAGGGLGVNDQVVCITNVVGTPADLSNFFQVSYSVQNMQGATGAANGIQGIIPAPLLGEQNKFLKGSADWVFLDASDIASGTFDPARINNLSAAQIVSGTFANGLIGAFVGATSGTPSSTGGVPVAVAGEEDYVLKADSTWQDLNTYNYANITLDSNVITSSGQILSSYIGTASDKAFVPRVTAEHTSTGFENTTDSALSTVTGTRTFTLTTTGTYTFYVKGNEYTYNTNKSKIWPNTTGIKTFYFDINGDIQVFDGAFSDGSDPAKCKIASLYWNATTTTVLVKVSDQRHLAIWPVDLRYWDDEVNGTSWISGMIPNSFTISDGSLDAHAQFETASGIHRDADLRISTPFQASNDGMTIVHRDTGGTDLTQSARTGFNFLAAGTGRVAYDNAGTQTEATEGYYVLCHVATGNGGEYYSIQGRAEYDSISASTAGAKTEWEDIEANSISAKDIRPVGTIILQTSSSYTNTVKARVVQTPSSTNYIDFRKIISGTLSGAVSGDDVSLDTSGFTTNLSGTDLDVQTAMGTIDQLVLGGGGGGLTTEVKTANFTVESGKRYIVNSASIVSATLPATIVVGDEFQLISIQSDVLIKSGAASQSLYIYPVTSKTSTASDEPLATTSAKQSAHWVADTTTSFYEVEQGERTVLTDAVTPSGYILRDGNSAVQGLRFTDEAVFNTNIQNTTYMIQAAGVSSSTKGYAMGGALAGTPTSSVTTSIESIQYADESYYEPSATLSLGRWSQAGITSALKGYALGGTTNTFNDSVTNIDGIQYSDESSINPAATLSLARLGSAGVSNSDKGYALGGYTTTYSDVIDGIQFSNEAALNPAATLSLARYDATGVSSSTRGYAMGGNSGPASDVIDGIQFSNDTAFTLTATLSLARAGSAGTNSSTRAYVMGGYPGGATGITIDGIQFSDEGAFTVSATLGDTSTAGAGVSSTTTASSSQYDADYDTTDTSNFSGNLSANDSTVQKALETLDQLSGSGDVVGPASSTNLRITTFNGTSGKLISESTYTVAGVLARANHTGSQLASTISDFDTQVQSNALDTLSATTDITTLNTSITAHGLCPKLSNVVTEFLNGAGAFSTPAGGGSGDVVGPASSTDLRIVTMDGTTGKLISESSLTVADITGQALDTFGVTTDVTSLNVSITAHGLCPKLSNVVTEYLNGTGSFSTPAGSGSGGNALVDGATITPDLNDGDKMYVTLAGNRTLANPSNVQAYSTWQIEITQDATGSRTLAYGTNYLWAGGTAPTLSTAANAIDIVTCTVFTDITNIHSIFHADSK